MKVTKEGKNIKLLEALSVKVDEFVSSQIIGMIKSGAKYV